MEKIKTVFKKIKQVKINKSFVIDNFVKSLINIEKKNF